MSLPEDQENMLSQKMSEISIEANNRPRVDWNDIILTRHRETIRAHMTFLKTDRNKIIPMQHLEAVDGLFQNEGWQHEYQSQMMQQLMRPQEIMGMAELNKPCEYCKTCRNNERLKREQIARNNHNKWVRYHLSQRKIKAAKIEREREIWKRRKIENTMLDNLLIDTQRLIDNLERFQHFRANCSKKYEIQPSAQIVTVDDYKSISLSEANSVTSTLPTNSD